MIVNATELEHHGILGMKWGVRNGPPYPLNDKVSDRIVAKAKEVGEHHAENKAKRSEGRSQAAEIDKQIKSTKEKYVKACTERDEKGAALAMAELEKLHDKKESVQREHGLLTDEQKRKIAIGIAAGAAVGAGVALIAYGAHKSRQNGDIDGSQTWTQNDQKRNKLRQDFFLHGKLEDLPDQDMTFKSGHVFSRVDTHGYMGYNKKDGARMDGIYCACNSKDAARYRQMLVRVFNRGDERGNFHSIKFTMDHDVKVPSARKRYSTFVELMQNDHEFVYAMYRDGMIFDNDGVYNDFGGFAPDSTRKRMAQAEPRQFANYYQLFSQNFIGKGEAAQRYAQALAKKGYNAIIDDNDAGRLSDAPLILLDASGLNIKSDKVMNSHSKAFEAEGRSWEKYENHEKDRAFLVHRTKGGTMVVVAPSGDSLMHYGVMGMKWGVRKQERYSQKIAKAEKRAQKYSARAAENRAVNRLSGDNTHFLDDYNSGRAQRIRNVNAVRKAKLTKMTASTKAATKQANAKLLDARIHRGVNNYFLGATAQGKMKRLKREGYSPVAAGAIAAVGQAVRYKLVDVAFSSLVGAGAMAILANAGNMDVGLSDERRR